MPNPEEYRRTRRIVDLLLRIAGRPRYWTRRRLADLYELSQQQLDKDLRLVRHGLRLPLCHVAQGYYFERLAVLPSLTLTLPEALALLLAARLGQRMPGVSRSDLAAAIARVEALLPPELGPLAAGLGPDGGQGEARDATLLELQMAIAERCRLRMVYRSASHEGPPGEREVDPYSLLPHERSWYLVGLCHLRREVRIFKVDRIERMERTGGLFALPAGFSLESYLGDAWGLLRGEAGPPEEVALEFEPSTARWVRDQHLHPSQVVEDLPDGRARLTLRVPLTPDLRRWVFGFGPRARVLAPAHLAEWVQSEARAVVESMEASR